MPVNQAVWTEFKARDDISSVFKKMGKNSKKFGRDTEAAFKKASKSALSFKKVTGSIVAAGAISKMTGLATQGLREVVTQFISFDDAIVSASAKFKGLDLTTEKGQKTLAKLKTTAREVGAATQFTATEAAQGLDFLALAGFNATQAMASLPGVVNLATVAQVDLARSVDIASDSLGAFGLMTEDSVQLQKNFTRVNDVMAKTMASTNTNLEDMFEAVKKGAPDFTAAGQSIETFSAFLGIMANSGVKGSEAGTKLRMVMTRLAKPTGEAMKMIKKLGVNIQDSNGNFRDALDILTDLEKGTKKLGTAQKSAAFATIFGARNQGAINILLKEGTSRVRAFREELIGAAGSSQKMADIMRQSLGNRLKALGSALIEVGFKILGGFKGNFENAIEGITQAVRNFNPKPLIDGIKTIISLFDDFLQVAKLAINVSVIYGAALLAINAKAIIAGAGIKIVSVAIGVLSTAMKVFGFIANLSFGGWIAAIGLVVSGIVLLWKNWDDVSSFIIKSANSILNIFTAIWKIIKNIGGSAISFVLEKLGIVDSEDEEKSTIASSKPMIFTPPNKTEEESKKMNFFGTLKFENAPETMVAETKTIGGPPMRIEGLGAN